MTDTPMRRRFCQWGLVVLSVLVFMTLVNASIQGLPVVHQQQETRSMSDRLRETAPVSAIECASETASDERPLPPAHNHCATDPGHNTLHPPPVGIGLGGMATHILSSILPLSEVPDYWGRMERPPKFTERRSEWPLAVR